MATATGQQVLPFYFVFDESKSMEYNGGIEAINQSLPNLHAAIARDPLVNDKTRISMISFSSDAQVLVPLTSAADITEVPGVVAKSSTNYDSVFELLKSQIPSDITSLKDAGYAVLRPTVFFISDGEPTDPGKWEKTHADLTDPTNPRHANIIAFGVDAAEKTTMARVATIACFLAEEGIDPGAALREIIRSCVDSVVQSATSSGSGMGAPTPTLIIPAAPPGSISIPLHPLD